MSPSGGDHDFFSGQQAVIPENEADVSEQFGCLQHTPSSTYAGSPDDISDAIELLRSGKVVVKDMITHRFGIADAGKGFELVAKAKDSIKVLIEPQR